MTEPTPRRRRRPYNLFVYGTLMVPGVFRAVMGFRLAHDRASANGVDTVLARDAVLPGYKKISPDGAYLYAVPDPQGRINGYIIGPLPGESLAALKRYEGRNYRQVRVQVQTAEGPVWAIAFAGNLPMLSHSFGWAFRDPLKQEVLLRGKIEKALLEDELQRLNTDEELTRRALSELHGRTIRDLIRQHFDAGGISTFAIRQALRDDDLRDFSPDVIAGDDSGRFASNYLSLVIRQVMFNQIEDRIRDDFRFELDRMGVSEKFYERTISALAALRLVNQECALLTLLTGDALTDLPFRQRRLIDYVRWAVHAADAVYEPLRAQAEIRYIQTHLSPGAIPLGAELEFSNIGHDVIGDPAGKGRRDGRYDGFLYFGDFALDILTWKLGGHVDDHRVKHSDKRRRGFFELALGNLSVEANISKPITDDPWLLNQIIQAAMEFYDVAPHSLHVSMQLPPPNRPEHDRPLPLGVLKCLLALAGDPARDADGRVRIRRLSNDEIVRDKAGSTMLFSQVSRRRSAQDGEEVSAIRGKWVQQFKFLRLSPKLNYEPLIMALKGLQIHFKPGSFLTAHQVRSNPELGRQFHQIIAWGLSAEPLTEGEIEEFLGGVHEGLTHEHRGRPAHSLAYIAYCLAWLRTQLHAFNTLFAPPPPAPAPGA